MKEAIYFSGHERLEAASFLNRKMRMGHPDGLMVSDVQIFYEAIEIKTSSVLQTIYYYSKQNIKPCC